MTAVAVVAAICLVACETAAHAQGAPPGQTVVHINADRPVVLQQLVDGSPWRDVCLSPCDAPLPSGALYRVSGPGTRDSTHFLLHHEGRAVLDVKRGRPSAFAGGMIILTTIGPATSLLGFGLILGGVNTNADRYLCSRYPDRPCPTGTTFIASGVITLAVAVGLTVVGTFLVATNAATKVAQPIPPPESRRRPEWSAEPLVAAGTPWMFPLATATF